MEATSGNATVTVHIGKIRDKIERYSPDDSILKQSGELAIDLEIKRVLSFSGHNMRGK